MFLIQSDKHIKSICLVFFTNKPVIFEDIKCNTKAAVKMDRLYKKKIDVLFKNK